MATAAFRHSVKLDQVDPGIAFLNVQLAGPIDGSTAQTVAAEVSKSVASMEGRPFGLLIDLREVTACDEAGAGVMQNIEMGAADKGLEVIVHLVKQKEVVAQSNAAMKEAGADKLFGTFDDEVEARRFASGLIEGAAQ